jgi:hypothetical protein
MPNPPEGWDNDIPLELVEGARQLRKLFIALQMAGFTAAEAAMVVGCQMAANSMANPGSQSDG